MAQHIVTQYATDIVYGGLAAGKWERLACQRHLEDLKRQNTLDFPYVFDETRADRIIKWFRLCRHVRGCYSGEPIELLPAWAFDLGNIFGWVEADTGVRRYKTAYIRVARGNAKSTVMSGVANYGMCADGCYRPGTVEGEARYERKPEVVCIAVDRGQAEIVWGDARDMAIASPEIAKRLNVQKTKISHKTRGGELRKLSKDTKNKDGGAPCIIIVDEYHDHPTSEVKDKTAYGKGKRTQSLEIIITTAGEDAENKPCKIEDDTVKKILTGDIVAESYYGSIREIDDDDDPHDERVWVKANPIFRVMTEYSRSIYAEMKNEHDLAFGSGDNSKIRQWMIKRVNRWQVDAENKYFSGCMDRWKEAAIPRSDFLALVKGIPCWAGVDLSKCIDLTGLGFVWRLPDERFAVSAVGFCPENVATAHEHTDRVPYRDWASEGWAVLTEGDVTDDRYVIQHIHDVELDGGHSIVEVCYDPYNARQMCHVLTDEGYTCVEIRQGVHTLSEPTKRFKEMLLQGRIVHDGSPLLRWCLSNAVEVTDNNGNIKLSKKHKDDSQRIDPLAALMNAFVRAWANEEDKHIYETRGLRSLGDD